MDSLWVYGGTRYLVILEPEKHAIFDRIRYLVSQKSGIVYFISHNFARIKVGSYDSLPLEKTMTLHNIIIHIKSVFNKDQNHCYSNTFLENTSYQLSKR